MVYLAHKDGELKQTLRNHLAGTSQLAGQFAEAFHAGDAGRFCGNLHDIGKYSGLFQDRLFEYSIFVNLELKKISHQK